MSDHGLISSCLANKSYSSSLDSKHGCGLGVACFLGIRVLEDFPVLGDSKSLSSSLSEVLSPCRHAHERD